MRNSVGYSLVELLVVVAIVGILASIAITNFEEYRTKSFNSVALSDLRNAIGSQEAYYTDNQSYISCTNALNCESSLPGFKASKDDAGASVLLNFNFTATAENFTALSRHEKGDVTYSFDSSVGSIETS